MARIGYLKRDQQEKGNGKPGYSMRAAWRVVDPKGRDMFQPWADTRKEAKEIARELGIDLQPEPKPGQPINLGSIVAGTDGAFDLP